MWSDAQRSKNKRQPRRTPEMKSKMCMAFQRKKRLFGYRHKSSHECYIVSKWVRIT